MKDTINGVKEVLNKYEINYVNTTFITLNHILALYSLRYIDSFYTLCEVILFYQMCAISITSGLHRLWSHRSYKATDIVRFILMLFISASNQASIYHWVRDHRVHHRHSDTDADPHNINKGFFYSHVGWLLVRKNKEVINAGKNIDCSDLLDDWVVQLNLKLWPYGDLFMCYVVPGIYGYYFYDSIIKGVLLLGVLRWIMLSHATWCVNSVAHMFGDRPFRKNIKPVENKWVSLLSVGEGWHNWHHSYPYDYAASDEGVLLRWNPTKLFIDILGYFGQTYDHKRKIKNKK
tara:strand:- start:9014 stop:9883 length:870 start_codon:yes stop_codon:yes gene_type:complete